MIEPFRRSETDLVIRALRGATVCFARIYHHLRVRTPCTLPRTGPGILVCNHLSALDPILIQAACPRLIRWMMAREYYQQKSLKWLLDLVGVIPVERTGRDTTATRAALTALKDGYILGVFPEGRIELTDELIPFQAGVALLAAKSKATVYPAYLEGTQRGKEMLPAYLLPNSANLSFGTPLPSNTANSKHEDLTEMTAKIQFSVETLRKSEKYRGKFRI